ncbi:THO complex 1-like protein Hpr1 isoform X1 [Tachypleus tridentatus]|uniref:THO complex 1-like protein Hpr1 isoform X1 n=1 Tax=Tachypleus tridentatus TaxID=6853 RepID=UPI003FD68591
MRLYLGKNMEWLKIIIMDKRFHQQKDLLTRALDSEDISQIAEKCELLSHQGSEMDIKSPVDQAFRELLQKTLVEQDTSVLEKVIKISIVAAEKELCSGSLPVMLIGDMFDCLTLDNCEELFYLLEDRVDIWKRDLFVKNCKNQILRSCNDLLRRLSRSQNTVFCGRILVFLAKFFPLSERSGLNIVSEFNLENITIYSSKDDTSLADFINEKDEMEEGEMDDTLCPVSVDYNIYRKFWSLQEFFRQPNLCYNKINWKHFASYSADVLSAFGSFKLDDVRTTKWKLNDDTASTSEKPVYFAKYLTNQKLLELELSDINFRRYILIQFLILFHYLQSPVKFKQESFVLTDEQLGWIKETTARIYKLLEQTSSDGSNFSKNVAHILKREDYWNQWKNEGCPNFNLPGKPEKEKEVQKPARKRKVGDEIHAADSQGKILLGNAELNRLWNLCPDNWEACRSKKRDFVPSLEKYFEAAIEQTDPANQIENCFKHVYDGNYGWRALRLLSQKSPHFFTHSNQPIKRLPIYLESMVRKIAKELPQSHQQPSQSASDESRTEVTSMAGDGGEDSDDELLKNSEDGTVREEAKKGDKNQDLVTKTQLTYVAEKLQADWKILAPALGFEEDEIQYFQDEYSDAVKQASQMLLIWMEDEPEESTVTVLKKKLESVGLGQIGNTLSVSQ